MSPTAYFRDTKENIIKQLEEEKAAQEATHKQREEENKAYKKLLCT